MDSSQGFSSLRASVQAALVSTTRSVNGLANEDLQFQRTANPSIGTQLDDKSERLLRLASGLLKSAGNATGHKLPALEDADDVDIHWRGIVDVIDSLLEKADTCLDEYTGLIKRKDAPVADLSRAPKRPKSNGDRLDWSMKRANILKPQNAFEKKIDNFDSGPWKPLLTRKPHARVPLEESLVTFTNLENNTTQYKHPYEKEIVDLQYPQAVYETREPQKYLPVEGTAAIWVDTYEGVLEMLEELKQAKEIALDLEHHDFRTFTGLLSLMQISTREKDWIVDTLVPWRHKLEVLNEVFADPKIIKVLHGAFMDAIWLQRDLGLYVVGLFDTHHACGPLGYPGRSLAFLLKKFVDFDADKKYQLADWRIRPLPQEMLYYARSDTHYLLYIYDMVRNELVENSDRSNPEQDLIGQVVQKSKEVSLLRYENPSYEPETGFGPRGWYNALSKSATLYDSEQFAVYKALHQWRDELARREDESPVFFMTQQVLADVARILPVDKKALWSILDSNARTLKPYLDELFDLVQDAKAKGLNGPKMMDIFRESTNSAPQKGFFGERTAKSVVTTDIAVPDIKELKSDRSQFWGDIPISTIWDRSAKKLDDQTEIVLPYYQYIQQAAFEDAPSESQKPTKAVAEANPEAEAEVADREFTLKGSRKRKIEEANDESESDAEEAGSDSEMEDADAEPRDSAEPMAIDDEDDAPQQEAEAEAEDEDEHEEEASASESKASKKAARAALKQTPEYKAAKEARKAERKKAKQVAERKEKKAAKAALKAVKAALKEKSQSSASDEKETEDDQTPFDYSKAAPVLHALKEKTGAGGATSRGRGGKETKAFNPYSKKSGNAPVGAKKVNHVKAGPKSATFKK
ncbi:ribonuclease H-like domain-containing protein [Podospora appendiculata]|uniref:Ribonuclease H-like domain-containing protein n=1 Tax=Podospora appendiculata TaxID=314037 RepID=A0AAE0XBE3_9PEZI|nr:ribonuclease H-like domain-containing protein [Podospora appendiculata]